MKAVQIGDFIALQPAPCIAQPGWYLYRQTKLPIAYTVQAPSNTRELLFAIKEPENDIQSICATITHNSSSYQVH